MNKRIYGTVIHLKLENYNIENEIKLLKNLGIKRVRVEIQWQRIGGVNAKKFNFSEYDLWMQQLEENGIDVLVILNAPNAYFGKADRISTEEDVEKWLNYASSVIKQYPQVSEYEVMNEPNIKYMDDEGTKWYAKTVERSKKGF